MIESSFYKQLYLALQEISYAVVYTDKLSSVAGSLLDVAIDFASAEAGSLMLLNDRSELFVLSSRGLPPEYAKGYCGRIGEGIAGIVAKNRRPVLVQDISLHEEFNGQRRDHYKTGSFISCPVIFKERLLGIININDKRDGRSFTSDELGLLQIISNHAAIALENASLLVQLRSSAAALDRTNRRLVELDLLKTDFLRRISHELRTPLNAVNGAIHFLQNHDDVAAPERGEFHAIIATESNRLAATVNDLLKFLQFEDESLIIGRAVINIDELLRDLPAAAALRSSLMQRGLRLRVSAPRASLPVVGDRIRINQLFTNLLDALGDHLEAGDTIRISAREDDFIIVEIGLPREVPKTVLQHLKGVKSFFSGSPSDGQLKLYLAANIAHVHRWTMTATNSAGSCTITISILRDSKETRNVHINRGMDAFVHHISDALDLETCSVMLSDLLTGELLVRSARGLSDDVVKRTRITFSDRISGWVAVEGKPLFIENVDADPHLAPMCTPQLDAGSLICLPLKVDDRVIGVLNLTGRKKAAPFTRRDYQLAQALSDRVSGYLKRVHTDRFQEDDLHQFLSSVDALVRAETDPRKAPPRSPLH